MRLSLLLILIPSVNKAEEVNKEAVSKAAEATYKQLGIDKQVEEYVKTWTPETVKKYAPAINVIKQIAIDKQVSYKWDFK